MKNNKPYTKSDVSMDTVALELQMNNVYKQTYNFPDFEGTPKQITYANSLRLKLIDGFQKDKNTPENLKTELISKVFSFSNSKEFLDEFTKYDKKFLWYQYVSDFCEQATLTPNASSQKKHSTEKPPVSLEKSETWLISVFDENKITVRAADSSLNELLSENGFRQISDYFWEIPANINAVDRKAKENKIKDLLLDNGKQIKLEKNDPNPKPVYHDAVIYKNDTKILVDCRSIGTLQAFLGIGGSITIDITDCSQEEIKKLFCKNYDIGFADKTTEAMFK